MRCKLAGLIAILLFTSFFAGCAGFEYSEPGAYGYYEPNYYYDRYPHYYYHGPYYAHGYAHPFVGRAPVARPHPVAERGGRGSEPHDVGHDGAHH